MTLPDILVPPSLSRRVNPGTLWPGVHPGSGDESRNLVPGRPPALGALRGPGEAGGLPARRPQLIEFAGDRRRRPAQAHRQQLSVPELGPLASEGIEIGH